MKTKLFLTGLAIIAATAIVSAQQGNGRGCGKCNGTTKGTAYIDKNNNGVCDNSENRQTTSTVKKGNGTGKCDGTGQGRGKGQGKGKNFVDANKNGICDTYEVRNQK
jgi:hypothetical protein